MTSHYDLYGGGGHDYRLHPNYIHARRPLQRPTATATYVTNDAMTNAIYERKAPLVRAQTTPAMLAMGDHRQQGQLLYDSVPQPRCVSCVSCRCQLQLHEQRAAPHQPLMRWGSDSSIYNPYQTTTPATTTHQAQVHLVGEPVSLDSIDGPPAMTVHAQPVYGIRQPYVVQNLRRVHRAGPVMPLPLPLHSIYRNQFCVESSSPGDATTAVDESLGDVAGLAFKLRKTASNESFFGYPIDVIAVAAAAPTTKTAKKESASEATKRRTKAEKHAQQQRLVVRQTKSSPAAVVIEESYDANDLAETAGEMSFYGYLKPRQAKLSRHHQPLYGYRKGVELF